MHSILLALEGDNRNSLGDAEYLLLRLLDNPSLLPILFEAYEEHEVVQIRATHVICKFTEKKHKYVLPFQSDIMRILYTTNSAEIKWMYVQILKFFSFSENELETIFQFLYGLIEVNSHAFLTSHSMEALTDLSILHKRYREKTEALLLRLSEDGNPAIQARGRKCLMKLGKL